MRRQSDGVVPPEVLKQYDKGKNEIAEWWGQLPDFMRLGLIELFEEENQRWWDEVAQTQPDNPVYKSAVAKGARGERVMDDVDWQVLEPLLRPASVWLNAFAGPLWDGGLDIAERVGTLVAVDISPENEKIGIQRAAKRGVKEKVRYVVAPTHDVSERIEPHSIDGIAIWGGALMYDFRLAETLTALMVVLKSDGILYIRDRNPERIQGVNVIKDTRIDLYPPNVPIPVYDVEGYLPEGNKPKRPLFRMWYPFQFFLEMVDRVAKIEWIQKLATLGYDEREMTELSPGVFAPKDMTEEQFIQFQLLAIKKS